MQDSRPFITPAMHAQGELSMIFKLPHSVSSLCVHGLNINYGIGKVKFKRTLNQQGVDKWGGNAGPVRRFPVNSRPESPGGTTGPAPFDIPAHLNIYYSMSLALLVFKRLSPKKRTAKRNSSHEDKFDMTPVRRFHLRIVDGCPARGLNNCRCGIPGSMQPTREPTAGLVAESLSLSL